MRNISGRSVEKKKMHILYSTIIFENCAVYEIMSKNMVEPEVTNDNMAHKFCMLGFYTRARARARKHTHTQKYVKLSAFPRRQLLPDSASILL
jgi:hypothetical protein